MENKYEYMQPTVDKICKSLREEPNMWVFSTNIFSHVNSNIKYWDSLGYHGITDVWDGRNTVKVFSEMQGDQIREAYLIARAAQASVLQSEVISSVSTSANHDCTNSDTKTDTSFLGKLKRIFNWL